MIFERPLHQAIVDKMLHSECYPPGGQCCQSGGSCDAGEKFPVAEIVHRPMPSAAKVVTIAPPALPAVQIKTRAQKKALLAVPMVSRAQRVLNAAKTTMALIAPPSAYQHLSFPTWRDGQNLFL